jgi:hypothetical protein
METERAVYDGIDTTADDGMGAGSVSLTARNGRILITRTAGAAPDPWHLAQHRQVLARAIKQVMRRPDQTPAKASSTEDLNFDPALAERTRPQP